MSARVVTKSCEPKGGWCDDKIINHQVCILCGMHEVDGLEATLHHCVWYNVIACLCLCACLKVMQRGFTVNIVHRCLQRITLKLWFCRFDQGSFLITQRILSTLTYQYTTTKQMLLKISQRTGCSNSTFVYLVRVHINCGSFVQSLKELWQSSFIA